MAGKIEFIQNQAARVLCPHCEAELNKVYYKSRGFSWFLGRTHLYFCPHCSKAIGFSMRNIG